MEIRGEYGKDQRSRHQGDRVMLDHLPREKGYGGYQTWAICPSARLRGQFFSQPLAGHNDISQQNFSWWLTTTIFHNKISPSWSPQQYIITKFLLVVSTNDISQQNCMKGLSLNYPQQFIQSASACQLCPENAPIDHYRPQTGSGSNKYGPKSNKYCPKSNKYGPKSNKYGPKSKKYFFQAFGRRQCEVALSAHGPWWSPPGVLNI